MATWVDDIIQALKNLGGQAPYSQIYEEVKRIRTEPLPETYKASIRERIEAHSSDSSNFKGKDYFRKMEKGVWALRDQAEVGSTQVGVEYQSQVPEISIEGKEELMSTWIEDIVQALKNLGGQATRNQILKEVKKIRSEPLPPSWKMVVSQHIQSHSSDSQYYDGKKSDLFIHVDTGVWALRNQVEVNQHTFQRSEQKNALPKCFLPTESFDEIANILQTIKQYRDFKHSDLSSCKEYVDNLFNILGFSAEKKNPRLTTLNIMGSNHAPKAIVCFVHPGENFEEMVPGLSWESYLFFAANYYQIDWGILTDGLQLKIVCYQDHESKQPTYWPDFDEIVSHEKLDTFCTIYKVFSFIKGYEGKSIIDQGKQQKLPHGRNGEELPERYVLRLKFWGQLLGKAKTKTKIHANKSPSKDNWMSAGAGKSGLGLSYVVRMDDAQVELYIDRGKADWNKKVFNIFLQNKAEIEASFGEPLAWKLLSDKRVSRIQFLLSSYGLKDQDHWDELQDQLIDAMIRLEKVFRPYIQQLD